MHEFLYLKPVGITHIDILQGISATSATASPHPTLTKASLMINGEGRGGEVMDSLETEEEEEEKSSLELPIAHPTPGSVHHQNRPHFSRGRECSPQHLQELQNASQFPMSGDLPSLDPGLPSASLGFDISEVS